MKKTKLLTSLFMAMFMMAVCPQSVLADDDAFAVTINGETTTYANDAAAFAAAMEAESATVTLLSNYTCDCASGKHSIVTLSKGNITIDLNNYELSGTQSAWCSTLRIDGANVTIVDKSYGLGTLSNPKSAAISVGSGNLLIQNGIISGKEYGIYMNNETLDANNKIVIHGGTFKGTTSAIKLSNPVNNSFLIMDEMEFINDESKEVVTTPGQWDWSGFAAKSMTATQINPIVHQLNELGYATFSAKRDMVVCTPGIQTYKASVSGTDMILTAIDGYIPAGTGVLLYGGEEMAKEKVEFAYAYGNAADMSGNDLLPTTQADGSLVEKPANDVVYALGPQNEFLEYTASAFIHNRAYLTLPVAIDSKAMKFVFAEETAIKSVAADKTANVSKFIENGKLVIMKNGVKYNVMGVRSF